MHRHGVTSKLLKSVAYNTEKKILEVEFLAKRNEDVRRVYQYFDVPMEKALEMSVATSVGGYFLTMIKPNYKCVRVMETNDENKTKDQAPDTTSTPPDSEKGA
jgi:hypothetical protein